MRIFNLTKKTGNLSSNDFFGVDNGSTVNKIDYNALAKTIIEQYTGSSLAGSAQSVKAALDALNSNRSKVPVSGSVNDLDSAVGTGSYILSIYNYTNSANNKPSSAGGRLLVIGIPTYFTQVAFPNASTDTSCFMRNYGASGFTGWREVSFAA